MVSFLIKYDTSPAEPRQVTSQQHNDRH